MEANTDRLNPSFESRLSQKGSTSRSRIQLYTKLSQSPAYVLPVTKEKKIKRDKIKSMYYSQVGKPCVRTCSKSLSAVS